MLSRTEYHEMMNVYQYALEEMASITSFVDDETGSAVSAGGDCRQRSGQIVADMNDLCVNMKRWIKYFEANAEVE